MPINKVTAYFEAPGSGWSENWYMDVATPIIGVNTMVDRYGQLRMALVAASDQFPVTMTAVRSQVLENPLDSRLESTAQVGTYQAGEAVSADMPWTGMLARATSTTGAKRSVFLRGIPDDVAEGSWRTSTNRNKWIKAYFDFALFCQNTFKIQSLDEGANPLMVIDSIAAGAGTLLVTTQAAHGLAADLT